MRTLPNEPVVQAATITGLISAGLVMLVTLGIIDIDTNAQAAIMGFVALAVPIAISFWPRSVVTPLNDPQITTKTGEVVPLVRADTGLPPKEAP